jgi:hypothetical protein
LLTIRHDAGQVSVQLTSMRYSIAGPEKRPAPEQTVSRRPEIQPSPTPSSQKVIHRGICIQRMATAPLPGPCERRQRGEHKPVQRRWCSQKSRRTRPRRPVRGAEELDLVGRAGATPAARGQQQRSAAAIRDPHASASGIAMHGIHREPAGRWATSRPFHAGGRILHPLPGMHQNACPACTSVCPSRADTRSAPRSTTVYSSNPASAPARATRRDPSSAPPTPSRCRVHAPNTPG